MKAKFYQSGRSMIEMLGVLAIVGVLSAGGIAGYSMAIESYKTQALIEKVHLISVTARNLCRGNYAGISASMFTEMGKLKEEDFKNPFGGNLTIAPDDVDSGYFVIDTGYNTPPNACSDIVLADWGAESVFAGVYVDWTISFSYSTNTYPASVASTASACKSGNRRMGWKFK